MQVIISQILKSKYFYSLFGILLIILLAVLFYKRIKILLESIKIQIRKTSTYTLNPPTTKNSKSNRVIKIRDTEIENSKTGDIEGEVSIDNVKIKNSSIGSIRGR